MPRRGDDAEAEALQVVVRAQRRASARARSRCMSRRRRDGSPGCGPGPAPAARGCGGVGEGREGASASAVGAGVAELEALVDEGEVGQQVAGGGVGDDRPVRVRAGAQAQPLDAPVGLLDDAERRAARALDAAGTDRRPGCRRRSAPPARAGGRAARRAARSDWSSSRARCSSRAATSPAGLASATGAKPS